MAPMLFPCGTAVIVTAARHMLATLQSGALDVAIDQAGRKTSISPAWFTTSAALRDDGVNAVIAKGIGACEQKLEIQPPAEANHYRT